MRSVYFDNSATTCVRQEAAQAALEAMTGTYGNPSSLHRLGLAAEKILKGSRQKLGEALGCPAEDVIFTSGGTESDNTALFGAWEARKRRGNRIITTQVEHPAILETCRRLEEMGADLVYLPVDQECRISLDDLAAAVNEKTILVSIMSVNNETGTIMPIREAAARKGNALFHTDAVQAFGKIPLVTGGVDLISVSGHKIHAPKGIGALYAASSAGIKPFIYGGGQEKGRRSGTENMPGIAAFGVAAELAAAELTATEGKLRGLRDHMREAILTEIPDVRVNSPQDACPSVFNVSCLGTRGEVILHSLEQEGICVSTGSACSAGKKGGSHVLKAMGLKPKEVESALRFSFSYMNTEEEVDYAVEKLKAAVTRFRRLGSFR